MNRFAADQSTDHRHEIAALLGLFVCLFLVAAPTFEQILVYPDIGSQLSKGFMILEGRHPWLHIDTSVYGPALFYGSALAEAVGTSRVASQLLLIFVAHFLSYTLLFVVVSRHSSSRDLLLCFALLCFASILRFEKGHVILAQAAFLFGLHRAAGVERPCAAARLLALACTVAGLLRLDFGGYAVVVSIAYLALRFGPRGPLVVSKTLAVLAMSGLALSSPWWMFLASAGNLWEISRKSIEVGGSAMSAMSKPLPEYQLAISPFEAANFLSLSYPLFKALPLLVLALWVASKAAERTRRPLDRRELFLPLAAMFAALVFLQAGHRVDIGHVKQCLPSTLLVAVLGWEDFRRNSAGLGKGKRRAAEVLVAALAAGLLVGLTPPSLRPPVRLADLGQKVFDWTRTNPENLTRAAARGSERARLLVRLRELSEPGEPILVLPYYPQSYYLTGRGFATPNGWWNPGRFRQPGSEMRFIRALSTTNLVADAPAFAFDDLPERNARFYAPEVLRYLYSEFGILQQIGEYLVLARRSQLWRTQGQYPLQLSSFDPMDPGTSGPANDCRGFHIQAVNTLPVERNTEFSMPLGAGLSMSIADPVVPNQAGGCLLVLAQSSRNFVVSLAGQPQQLASLAPDDLISTAHAEPGLYDLRLVTANTSEILETGLRLELTPGDRVPLVLDQVE